MASRSGPAFEGSVRVPAAHLRLATASLFERLGLESVAAALVADALVEADLEGIPSHGVMLVPMYAARLIAGSVTSARHASLVSDHGCGIVLDGANMLGQLSATQACDLAVERARETGMAGVAVRNAFHFGMAARYARGMAERDCIGIVLSNTRPLMPAPGGRDRVVGNNPLAIAMPAGDGHPVEIDMAMSATAMGKIRLAQQHGQAIPKTWATDADGAPTDDPAAAIAGMLLPAAGPKGFGLAFMIDLLCGALSGGGVGDQVRPLYGDSSLPYNCAHFFLALHVPHFRPMADFLQAVDGARGQVRASRCAPGADRIYAPGDLGRAHRDASAEQCLLAPALFEEILALSAAHGASVPAEMLETQEKLR